jgi:hypothetical protein
MLIVVPAAVFVFVAIFWPILVLLLIGAALYAIAYAIGVLIKNGDGM